ncbi:AI-2E family transporter [Streptococcus cameli]
MNTSFKEKIALISFAALVLLAVLNYGELYQSFQWILGSMNSLFVGGMLAFVLNVPMKKTEELLEKLKLPERFRRGFALASVLVAFVLIVTGLVLIVLPTLTTTISQLVTVVNTAIPKIGDFLTNSGFLPESIEGQVKEYLASFKGWDSVSGYVTAFLSGLVANVGGLFSNVLTLIMAFFFTISILTSKEHLSSMAIKLLNAFFSERIVRMVHYIGEVIVDTYDKFLMSQIVEAVIIGTLVFVSYSLFGMPYAAMAGILSGVLSFIPYIGPLSACLISALFIAVQDPLLGLGSIVLFQVIQLIEGNVIYPRVVGQSVGLPTLFTLAAALIGGNLFGLLGMVFFTPIFAVVYRLVREWTYRRLAKKDIECQDATTT